jgi:hypothetical protein
VGGWVGFGWVGGFGGWVGLLGLVGGWVRGCKYFFKGLLKASKNMQQTNMSQFLFVHNKTIFGG